MCKNLNRDFHGCFNHFLNLVCKLFFDSVKKAECEIEISDDEEEAPKETQKEGTF